MGVDTSNSNQPAPVPSFTPSLSINSPPPAAQLQTNVFFRRVLCSLHSSQSRSSHPLPPHRPCPSHPLSSHQGSCPYRPRCGVLRTTFFDPWIALDNRGFHHPPCRWGIPPRSVHLHRRAGPSLEKGEPHSHSSMSFRLTSIPPGCRCSPRKRLIHLPPTLGFRSRHRPRATGIRGPQLRICRPILHPYLSFRPDPTSSDCRRNQDLFSVVRHRRRQGCQPGWIRRRRAPLRQRIPPRPVPAGCLEPTDRRIRWID